MFALKYLCQEIRSPRRLAGVNASWARCTGTRHVETKLREAYLAWLKDKYCLSVPMSLMAFPLPYLKN